MMKNVFPKPQKLSELINELNSFHQTIENMQQTNVFNFNKDFLGGTVYKIKYKNIKKQLLKCKKFEARLFALEN